MPRVFINYVGGSAILLLINYTSLILDLNLQKKKKNRLCTTKYPITIMSCDIVSILLARLCRTNYSIVE